MKKISVLFLLTLTACGGSPNHLITKQVTSQGNYGHFTVTKNVDGDSLRVTDKQHSRIFEVRFLEIDTPETHDPRKVVQCYGPEASKETASLLPVGASVTLKSDSLLDKTDRYGRTLAYVIKRNLNINIKLVKLGYAHAYHYQGKRGMYAVKVDRAEAYAKKHQLGFWSPQTCNGDTVQPAKP